MILPPRLRPGDKMAVFSPSSPATVTAKKRYQRGKSYLEKKGFVFQEGILTGKTGFLPFRFYCTEDRRAEPADP